MAETYSAGIVTAYGAAVRGGYDGTYEQWCEDMAQLGDNVAEVREKAEQVEQTAQEFTEQTVPAAIQSVEDKGTEQVNAVGTAGATQVQEINDTAVLRIGAVNAAGAAQVQAVETAGTDATDSIEAAGTAATSDIGTAKDTALTALRAESTTQQAAIQQKGETTRASIPDDYTALSDEVVVLKNTKAPAIFDTASGAIASFDDGADGMPLKSLTVNIEPVQTGSGDPSPENVRPITGWTGCNVSRSGKNLLDPSLIEVGSLAPGDVPSADGDTRYRRARIGLNAGIYTFSTSLSNCMWIRVFIDGVLSKSSVHAQTLTIELDKFSTVSIACREYDNTEITDFTAQIELGSAATSYESFVGNTTYPITFPASAGTVYGGTLTINADGSGELTVTMAEVDLGTLTWTKRTTMGRTYFGAPLLDMLSAENRTLKIWCTQYASVVGGIPYGDIPDKSIYNTTISQANSICVIDTSYDSGTANDFASAMSEIGVKAFYPLAQPAASIPLTASQITTLLGANNIWADCGDVTVEYPADTKLYIDRINAPTDDDMIADTQIDSGKYFLIGNNLYLSTTVIPAGDTIIPGTNCTKTNLAAALNALNT